MGRGRIARHTRSVARHHISLTVRRPCHGRACGAGRSIQPPRRGERDGEKMRPHVGANAMAIPDRLTGHAVALDPADADCAALIADPWGWRTADERPPRSSRMANGRGPGERVDGPVTGPLKLTRKPGRPTHSGSPRADAPFRIDLILFRFPGDARSAQMALHRAPRRKMPSSGFRTRIHERFHLERFRLLVVGYCLLRTGPVGATGIKQSRSP
jgi:hypothetical protein